jgi:hypothetical protein
VAIVVGGVVTGTDVVCTTLLFGAFELELESGSFPGDEEPDDPGMVSDRSSEEEVDELPEGIKADNTPDEDIESPGLVRCFRPSTTPIGKPTTRQIAKNVKKVQTFG